MSDDKPQGELPDLEAQVLEGRRQLIVIVNEEGELEIEGDDFAAWEMIGLGAFVMQFGEDNLMAEDSE